jgi:hypothetical protein
MDQDTEAGSTEPQEKPEQAEQANAPAPRLSAQVVSPLSPVAMHTPAAGDAETETPMQLSQQQCPSIEEPKQLQVTDL